MFPTWLHWLSIAGLLLGFACAAWVLQDVVRRPQKMGVMNVVWPVTALFGTLLIVWGYARYGRAGSREAMEAARQAGRGPPAPGQPFAAVVAKGALHCGAGCMIGDLIAEWLAFLVPAAAVWFGWHSVFARLRPAGRGEHSGVLVPDAARDGVGLRHGLSGELVADQERTEREDVGPNSVPACAGRWTSPWRRRRFAWRRCCPRRHRDGHGPWTHPRAWKMADLRPGIVA